MNHCNHRSELNSVLDGERIREREKRTAKTVSYVLVIGTFCRAHFQVADEGDALANDWLTYPVLPGHICVRARNVIIAGSFDASNPQLPPIGTALIADANSITQMIVTGTKMLSGT
jgi:hypothetical protein